MMAFVLAATRFDEDKSAYFEHFFIDFLDRRGISYSIVNVDERTSSCASLSRGKSTLQNRSAEEGI